MCSLVFPNPIKLTITINHHSRKRFKDKKWTKKMISQCLFQLDSERTMKSKEGSSM